MLLSPLALKVVGPLLLDSNSSRYDTNPPFPIPYMATHKQGNKETSNNQRQKKNEMKAKPIEF